MAAIVGAPPAPPPAPADEDEGVADALSKEVFATYNCRSLDGLGAVPHPGDIAEPASLAAIPLPPSAYPLAAALPPDIISSGKLSALQLEGVLHACSKHLSWLPSDERAGFFIGDGAGVGKGRQIAGIIIDSYARGRRKAVWVSTSTDLYADAVRDLRDLGAHIPVVANLQALDKATNTPTEGVLFATYSTLTSTVKGRSRAQQLADWLGGAAFDGVLVFDEAHKMKHSAVGNKEGTKVAATAVALQRALPAARVVYCSATGVSEVGNMAYLTRLGLFGAGSAFPTFDAFLGSLKRKGISFLELLAMELKGQGFYVCRGLSFRSAEFLELEVPLTPEQAEQYDAAVALWVDLRAALAQALAATGAAGGDVWKPFWAAQQRFFKSMCVSAKVPAVVAETRAALAAGQCVVIGLQSTGEAAADALNLRPGDACGFVSVAREIITQLITNHFPTTRHPDAAPPAPPADEADGTSAGALAPPPPPPPPTAAAAAAAEEVPEAADLKSEMLARAAALRLPTNFLDQLIDSLGGKGAVAEMTGRKGRVVRSARGRGEYELRGRPDSAELDSLNIREKDAFMAGKKLVAIVSDAASTGISLHASASALNRRRRVHLTIELPWSADKAIQQLGRSHRSNQVSAPLYKLVFTDLGGERRFAAAVARRLQSLGALTRGDRRAASGLDLGSLNYDSPLGRKALRRMYDALVCASPLLPPGVALDQVLEGVAEEAAAEFRPAPAQPGGRVSAAGAVEAVQRLHASLRSCVDIMGVGLAAPRGDTVAEEALGPGAASAVAAAAAAGTGGAKDAGDVRRFLNRLLAVPCERQRLLFNYFQLALGAEIRAAKAAGQYTEGVSDLPGQRISRAGPPQVLWTDPLTGLPTLRHDLAVDRGASFAAARSALDHEARHGDRSGFYRSRRPMPGSGRTGYLLALQKPGGGGVFAVTRPNTGPSFFEMEVEELQDKYALLKHPEDAREGWEAAYDAALRHCGHGAACAAGDSCQWGRRLTVVTILTGSVVRIWDSLERVLARNEGTLSRADRTMRIVRVELGAEGEGAGAEGGPPPAAAALPLIGVRYPGDLLAEVVAALSAQGMAAGAAAGAAAQSPAAGAATRVEAPTPVDARALKKAFCAPKTVLDFFKPRASPAPGAGPSGSAAAAGGKRPAPCAPDAAAPPPKKKAAVKEAAETGAGTGRVLNATSNASAPAQAEPSKRESGGGGGGGGKRPPDGGDIAALSALGFTQGQCERALRVNKGDVQRAANWLFAQP